MESSVESNLRLMTPGQVRRLILENEGFAACPRIDTLEELLNSSDGASLASVSTLGTSVHTRSSSPLPDAGGMDTQTRRNNAHPDHQLNIPRKPQPIVSKEDTTPKQVTDIRDRLAWIREREKRRAQTPPQQKVVFQAPPEASKKIVPITESFIDGGKETSEAGFALWFAGIAEAGITMDLDINRRKSPGKTYLNPRVRIIENDEEVRNRLMQAIHARSGISESAWVSYGKTVQLTGQEAVTLGKSIWQFAPSRRYVIDCYRRWSEGDEPEWSRIADEYSAHPNPTHLPMKQEDYVSLLQEPDFVAGVFDAYGSYTDRARSDRPGERRRSLRLRIRNHVLLETIGASLGVPITAPTVTGSREMRVSGPRAEEIYAMLAPHAQVLRLNEN